MKFSKRMDLLAEGVFSRLDEEKQNMLASGKAVYDFTIGSPNIAPSKEVMDALITAAQQPESYMYSLHDTKELKEKENLILNAEGQKLVHEAFVKSINDEVSAKGKKGNIKLSSTVGNFKGGFILEKDGIEINNTFEALVESMKEEMELEVAKALFN